MFDGTLDPTRQTTSLQPKYRLALKTILPAVLALSSYSFPIAAMANTEVPQPEVQHACYVTGLSEQVRCGSILVPENHQQPEGKQIAIHYTVLPAIKSNFGAEAFLAIAGGPGQSAIDNAAYFDKVFSKVRQYRDILLIDQRGTGRSNPLNCEGEGFEAGLALNDESIDIAATTQHCLDEQTADITQYGSESALKDFEAVRQHLGYSKLHLYGISYGSRMAQLYMRHYPQVLETVTLDGVVPMQQSVVAIGDAIERATQILLDECQTTPLCQQSFPTLAADFAKVDSRLAEAAITTTTRHPLTGEASELLLTRSKFMGAIRMAMYGANIRALLPYAINQAAQDNFQPILGLYALNMDGIGLAMGMHSSVVCGEDWPRLDDAMRQQLQSNYFGEQMLIGFDESCPIWNMPAVSKDFSDAIASDIPTLLLSGENDPATPPSWAELAMEKMTNATHLIAPYATHGVAHQSCANNLIADLVNSKDVAQLDSECLSRDVSRNFYLNASTVETTTAANDAQGASND
ncbi:alpha/beta hydrolase [Shewanella sp. Scap07]|uniref:alpha/beta hydrolase n=1 Tax=Shewanella sp. Scap07 TaxID=2589987 RepID=UPI0015BA7D9E|nr:alpha/beta fold hydrolase [Shewanella sp. Scap07]QLE83700.1 alpha/beta hydrolase [Shewanella sp. Scap07]